MLSLSGKGPTSEEEFQKDKREEKRKGKNNRRDRW